MDPEIKTMFAGLIEAQARTDSNIRALATQHSQAIEQQKRFSEELKAAHLRTEAAIANFVTSADARMKRIEENLDGLIRAITHEHSNGKAH